MRPDRLVAAQDASGAMRRPHVGQSLRSFWASWSHQLQKRRFSTAQGSREPRRRQRDDLAHDLELLAGVAVAVDAAGLGLDDDLAAASRACASGRAAAAMAAHCIGRRDRYARAPMRILIFHGYLLHGTGSNVYNARLAAALGGPGHDVDLLCQELRPEELRLRRRRRHLGGRRAARSGSCASRCASRPGARTSATCCRSTSPTATRASTAQAVPRVHRRGDRALRRRATSPPSATSPTAPRPDVALANHLVMGPLILARALGGAVPYAVKIHGSALEYVVKRDPERFLPAAREGLAGARTVLVGSRHTAESLWAAMGDDDAARAHAAGPARRRRRTSSARATAPRRPRGSARWPPACRPARRAAGERGSRVRRDEPAAGRALARLDLERDRHVALRRQAHRLQGRRPARGRLAARAARRARRAPRGRRLRRLPRGARAAAGRAGGGRPRRRPGDRGRRPRGRGRPARAAAPPARLPRPPGRGRRRPTPTARRRPACTSASS